MEKGQGDEGPKSAHSKESKQITMKIRKKKKSPQSPPAIMFFLCSHTALYKSTIFFI